MAKVEANLLHRVAIWELMQDMKGYEWKYDTLFEGRVDYHVIIDSDGSDEPEGSYVRLQYCLTSHMTEPQRFEYEIQLEPMP